MINIIELMEGSVLDHHKCPQCGVATPNIRTTLIGVQTCIKCTDQEPILLGVREKCGGGNSREYMTYRMPDGSLTTQPWWARQVKGEDSK